MGHTLTKSNKGRSRVIAALAALMAAPAAWAQDLDASVGNDLLTIIESFIKGNGGIFIGVLVLGGAVGYAAMNRDRNGALGVIGAILFLLIFYNIPGIVRMLQLAGA